MNAEHQHHASKAPVVTSLQVIPVAGHDSMLLNLSGAHGPFFTRNIVILKDSSGHIGVGEVPGGERIRETLEDARSRSTCASPSMLSPRWSQPCSTCSASFSKCRWRPCLAKASSAKR